MGDQTPAAARPVEVRAEHLPVFCPNPAMPLWSSHPRVYLDMPASGSVMCPYCGTWYTLVGAHPHGGH